MKVKFDNEEFSHWLKFYGYTQKELVEILNHIYKIDLGYLSLNRMINGRQNWTLEVAVGIVDIFEIPFSQLFSF